MKTQRQKIDAILNKINLFDPNNMNLIDWIKYFSLKMKFKKEYKKLIKKRNL
jgi:hypothetical protein